MTIPQRGAPQGLLLLLGPLIFSLLVRAAAAEKEDEYKNTGEGLHVIGLIGESYENEAAFLHSACRLNYPNVQVLRRWCSRPSGCEEDPRLEEHLQKLPKDDLIIIANLRDDFVYIVRGYEDARHQLMALGDSLVVAEVPTLPHDGRTMEAPRGGQVNLTVRETRGREGGREAMEEEVVEELETEKLESGKLEGNSDTMVGSEGETEEDKDTERNEGTKIERTETNFNGKSKDEDGGNTKGEDEMQNEVQLPTQDEAKERANNGMEVESENKEEKQTVGSLIHRALRGGVVLGRVRSLLEALQGQGQPTDLTHDAAAQYVLFGNRQKGGLSLSLPLQAVYTPEGGGSTHPILVYSLNEMIDFHNIIEVAGDTPGECPYTSQATPTDDEGRPRVLVALLLGDAWAPFLEEVLQGLARQDYPKDRMDVWIQAKSGVQEAEVSSFVEEHKDEYASLDVTKDQVLDMQRLRGRCVEVDCSFLLMMEPQALLQDPSTLSFLIHSNKSVVGPLLKQKERVNFVYSEDPNSPWVQLILDRSVRATLRVQEVRTCRLVRREALQDLLQGKPVEQFINTRVAAGVLLDPRGFPSGKRHPDLWGINHNRRTWVRRYIHPDLLRIIWKQKEAEEVGPYLYYVPFFSERFCRELVEEMEHFGKWQDKDKDDRDEAHQYTSTNINLSQIGYSREYHMVINSLNKELLATLYGGYRGLGHASLSFVLKYLPTTHYNTFKYHLDGATYTFNIALNSDFTGGGLQYKLGNKHFHQEREIFLPHNRTGWAVVQPNRPMHLHHGVGLDSGLRYALIAIIDTDDAGCKGGPRWVV